MKRTLSLILFLAVVGLQTPAFANAKLLREGQRAYLAGDHDTAELKFELVLAEDPKNPTARNYLRQIRNAKAKIGPKQQLERQLRQTIIPTIQFHDATLGSALDVLRQQIEKEGKVKTSFVLQRGVDPQTPVTLRLENVPATEVMRYIGQLVNVRFQVEDYAVSVQAIGSGSAATPLPVSEEVVDPE